MDPILRQGAGGKFGMGSGFDPAPIDMAARTPWEPRQRQGEALVRGN